MDPVGADVVHVLNFLSELALAGMAYRTVISLRSAISAGHTPVDGLPLGEHPLVRKLLCVVRISLTPEPRYSTVWDVSTVLNLFVLAT